MKMLLKKACLYFHTLRYLKPIQIAARVQKKVRKPKFKPAASTKLREQTAPWQRVIKKAPSLIGPTKFRFLNEEHDLGDIGWDNPENAKLWRYNLHYFEDLTAKDAVKRKDWHEDLISRWMAENPPVQGSAWEPYTVSLRIVNWIKWLLVGNTPPEGMMQSLADQTGWLSKNLEHHILGNHLFANAKALIFAGSFFEGPEADQWLKTGQGILSKELDEQILRDGGHFELSPMYHAIILEDVLDLIQIGQCFETLPVALLTGMEDKAKAMLHWLEVMSHPDGDISFFNDAAFGIAAENAQLLDYGQALKIENPAPLQPLEHLKDSGYIHARAGEWTTLLDVARIGPDYLPGHAHADCLSFELSHGQQRILVNSGISEYGLSTERLRQRGTAAHNTLEINGENSAEVWSGFRVARRGRPFDLDIQESASAYEITCAHNGYQRLAGQPIHKRIWSISAKAIIISDLILGDYKNAVAHFHFHPDVHISLNEQEQSGSIQYAEHLLKFEIDGGVAQLSTSTYQPEFGKTVPNQKLVVQLSSPRLIFKMRPS